MTSSVVLDGHGSGSGLCCLQEGDVSLIYKYENGCLESAVLKRRALINSMPDDVGVWRGPSSLFRPHHILHGVVYGGRGDLPTRTPARRPARRSACLLTRFWDMKHHTRVVQCPRRWDDLLHEVFRYFMRVVLCC